MIYFLQRCTPPVVPVLQEIKNPEAGHDQSQFRFNGADTYFFDGSQEELRCLWPQLGANQRSRGQVFFDFLRFYLEEFDYEKNVVCIRQTRSLLRAEKLTEKKKCKWKSRFLAIEDPFHLAHNVGSALNPKNLVYIFKTWHRAFYLFSSPLTSWLSSTDFNVKTVEGADGESEDGPLNKRALKRYPTAAHYLFDPALYDVCTKCGQMGCGVDEEVEWPGWSLKPTS